MLKEPFLVQAKQLLNLKYLSVKYILLVFLKCISITIFYKINHLCNTKISLPYFRFLACNQIFRAVVD